MHPEVVFTNSISHSRILRPMNDVRYTSRKATPFTEMASPNDYYVIHLQLV